MILTEAQGLQVHSYRGGKGGVGLEGVEGAETPNPPLVFTAHCSVSSLSSNMTRTCVHYRRKGKQPLHVIC